MSAWAKDQVEPALWMVGRIRASHQRAPSIQASATVRRTRRSCSQGARSSTFPGAQAGAFHLIGSAGESKVQSFPRLGGLHHRYAVAA